MSRRTVIRSGAAIAGSAVAAIALVGCSLLPFGGPTRDGESGDVVEGGSESVFSLSVGDCWNAEGGDEEGYSALPLVPCAEPHDFEIFALFDLPDGEFPGDAAIRELSGTGCFERFESYVGISYEESVLDIGEIWPSEGTWSDGDREVICSVFDPDYALEGTVKDSQQ